MTKEETAIYMKEWRANNKEKTKGYNKKYRTNNKNKYKLDFYIVYGLMCGYVGKTNNPYHRMASHRNSGRDTEGWFILGVVSTNEEAKRLEREYHIAGAKGHRHGKPVTHEERKRKMREYWHRIAKKS